jgi:hypothetical protein
MILRELTDAGIERFREFILSLKERPDMRPPNLDSPENSKPFYPHIEIDEWRTFPTRMDMAKYLSDIFQHAGLSRRDVIQHPGMWTWIACIWFDTICPVMNGARRVREIARYICSSHYSDYYRHYILANYDIHSALGEENSKLFLWREPHLLSDFIEQLASRQWFISSLPLVQVAHRLYWDENAKKPKVGATDRNRPGNPRRLLKLAEHFELTYDVHSMTPESIMELLPEEFNAWKT